MYREHPQRDIAGLSRPSDLSFCCHRLCRSSPQQAWGRHCSGWWQLGQSCSGNAGSLSCPDEGRPLRGCQVRGASCSREGGRGTLGKGGKPETRCDQALKVSVLSVTPTRSKEYSPRAARAEEVLRRGHWVIQRGAKQLCNKGRELEHPVTAQQFSVTD